VEHIGRNLPVERRRIEQTVRNIVPEIEAAALFNVEHGKVPPEPLLDAHSDAED
jgi:hypothetical protein